MAMIPRALVAALLLSLCLLAGGCGGQGEEEQPVQAGPQEETSAAAQEMADTLDLPYAADDSLHPYTAVSVYNTQAAQLLVKAGQFLGHTVKYVSVRILPGRCSISAMGIIPQLCKRKELPIAWKLRDMEVQKKTMLLPLLTMQGEIGTC